MYRCLATEDRAVQPSAVHAAGDEGTASEALLGGVSRDLLDHLIVPVLMSH